MPRRCRTSSSKASSAGAAGSFTVATPHSSTLTAAKVRSKLWLTVRSTLRRTVRRLLPEPSVCSSTPSTQPMTSACTRKNGRKTSIASPISAPLFRPGSLLKPLVTHAFALSRATPPSIFGDSEKRRMPRSPSASSAVWQNGQVTTRWPASASTAPPHFGQERPWMRTRPTPSGAAAGGGAGGGGGSDGGLPLVLVLAAPERHVHQRLLRELPGGAGGGRPLGQPALGGRKRHGHRDRLDPRLTAAERLELAGGEIEIGKLADRRRRRGL